MIPVRDVLIYLQTGFHHWKHQDKILAEIHSFVVNKTAIHSSGTPEPFGTIIAGRVMIIDWTIINPFIMEPMICLP